MSDFGPSSLSPPPGGSRRLSWSEAAFHALSDGLLVALGIAGLTLLFVDFEGRPAVLRNSLLMVNVALCSGLFAAVRMVRLRRASAAFVGSTAWKRSRLALLVAVSSLIALLTAVRLSFGGPATNHATTGLLVTSAIVAALALWRLRKLGAAREPRPPFGGG